MELGSNLFQYGMTVVCTCDALKLGVPLTTRQPAEYSWMSGNPTPIMKIGQSLLCAGSSTQIQPIPNSFTMTTPGPHASKIIGHLGPCINTHQNISQPIVLHGSRVFTLLLIQHILKFKILIHVIQNQYQSHNMAFF